jgi:hypothetical protein
MRTDIYIYVSSGIGTHDPSVLAGDDGWYLRPRGRYDRMNELDLLFYDLRPFFREVIIRKSEVRLYNILYILTGIDVNIT